MVSAITSPAAVVLINNIMKKLKSIEADKGKVTVKFDVGHNNGTTTVSQDLILEKRFGYWKAEMNFEDFPEQKTVTAAAWKLGDWLERLGEEIKKHEFDEINLNDHNLF